MPLTRRNNGSSPDNIITASWFNDFLDLLTGTMTDQPVTLANSLTVKGETSLDSGNIVTDGSGNLQVGGGKIGRTGTDGDIIEASGNNTYFRAHGGDLIFQPRGTGTTVQISQTALTTHNPLYLQPGSSISTIVCGSGLGIKTNGGTKLAEIKPNGNLLISGLQYSTAGGSVRLEIGQTFTGFDLAEIYPCDADYSDGTVVCPHQSEPILTLCTHDSCPFACVISSVPGYLMGQIDHEKFMLPVALAGRVNVQTPSLIAKRQLVCSNGNGGVRPLAPGEMGYSIGWALNETSSENFVGVFLRPLYAPGI